ncbi:hypothetical protein K710_1734 [Streptococcus iniae SF1]|nr:hypothetical protein K710_1734 [Streptococcus iniae SF1]EKB51931.1 hypothetical protein A0G_1837 [Streptococcus iniae 9117]
MRLNETTLIPQSGFFTLFKASKPSLFSFFLIIFTHFLQFCLSLSSNTVIL